MSLLNGKRNHHGVDIIDSNVLVYIYIYIYILCIPTITIYKHHIAERGNYVFVRPLLEFSKLQ